MSVVARFAGWVVAILAVLVLSPAAVSAGAENAPYHLLIGVQQSGTAQWTLTAMRQLGLDRKHGLELTLRPLASDQAGQIALQTGTVDIILSDFVWVSLARDRGEMVTMVPHSLAVGGLMVDPRGPVHDVADLKGRTIAASGTPVDKSWVILSAYYNRKTGGTLTRDATVRFGAPPLIDQLLGSGRADAALNFWSWNARARLEGMSVLIGVPEMLAGLGVKQTPPLLGWAFKDEVARKRPEAIAAFLAACYDTQNALASDDAAWQGLKGVMKVEDNDALFAALRDGYRAGIVRAYHQPEAAEAAAETFAVLARYGGKAVVGDATALAPGTFYQGFSR
jgi:NitT/TauT family transport system substrate-binding protein